MKDQINTIRAALESAKSSHGVMPLSDPPQDAWKYHGVDSRITKALTALDQIEAMAGEPVAWMAQFINRSGKPDVYVTTHKYLAIENDDNGDPKPLVFGATPPAQQYEAGDGASAAAQGFRDGQAAAQQAQPTTPQAATIEDAARDVGKWLNERPNRELDLRSVAMLVAHAQQAQAEAVPGLGEFLADLNRSRTKYPNNARMWDGLMGEVDELRRAYHGDGDQRAEAFDVAVCAFRIATEGDAGGNTLLAAPQQTESAPNALRWNYVMQRANIMSASKYEALCELLDVEVDEETFDLGEAIDAALVQQKGQP